MRISYKWLKELVDIPEDIDALSQTMTQLGMEVEQIEKVGADIEGVLVGKVVSKEAHPDADKLSVCMTDVGGDEPVQIICGATNFGVGDKVPTAVVGAVLPGDFKIDSRKMRGVKSFGMMCAAGELGLAGDDSGLMILPEDAPIGQELTDYLELTDQVIEIEVTPNRGDWAGMIGIARELAAHYQTALKLPKLDIQSTGNGESPATITIEDAEICTRYCGRVITNVKVGPSPEWMQQRIIAAGQRPINNIVDITNYVLLETAHPLHAFDYDKLHEGRIVVRSAKDSETIKTIDEEERKLQSSMLVIADGKEPIAVAGVMGGFDSEVGEGTTQVLLESASFSPRSVRATSKHLNLRSEASQRFQRGSDINMVEWAGNRAAQLICELAGGTIQGDLVDAYPGNHEPPAVELRYSRAGKFLGEDIPAETQDGYLARLGFEKQSSNAETGTFKTPTWRPDVSGEHDLIEEIARLHGYDNLPSTLPKVRYSGSEDTEQARTLNNLRRQLAAMGFTEFMGLSFTSKEALEKSGLAHMEAQSVALANPLSENFALMRPSLIPGILEQAAANIRKGAKGIRAFEIAPIYGPDDSSDTGARETMHLAVVLAGQPVQRDWSRESQKYDFHDISGLCETIFEMYNMPNTRKTEPEETLYQAGQGVRFGLKKTELAVCGKVNADTTSEYGSSQDIFIATINLDLMLERTGPQEISNDIPQFPASERDIAVIVDESAAAGDIVEASERAGGKLLQNAELIDIYTGEQIPDGKKSLAINLVYQAPDRTLTDSDTDKSVKKIIKSLTHQFGAELRG